ncbi:hypothetical protein HZC08_00120 [Candidatus Micrarchaeota archaeon]|nr:hypothetical protein [Candidatus Micrarchaeota archaeon]
MQTLARRKITNDTIYTLGSDPAKVRLVNRFITAARRLLEESLDLGGEIPRSLGGIVESRDPVGVSWHIRVLKDQRTLEEFVGQHSPKSKFSVFEPEIDGVQADSDRKYEGKKVAEKLVEEQIGMGKTISDIIKEFKLNRTEARILQLYIFGAKNLEQTATAVGRKKITVNVAVKSIINKLRGLEWDAHRKEKYRLMNEDWLRIALRDYDGRVDLHHRNHALFSVSEERGVLERVFPRKKTEVAKLLDRITNSVRVYAKKNELKKVLTRLDEQERNLVVKISKGELLKPKKEPAIRVFGKWSVVLSKLRTLERKLARTHGLTEPMKTLREEAERIGAHKLKKLYKSLRPIEVALITERALAINPKTFTEIGVEHGVSRGAACQIESLLPTKLQKLVPVREAG